MENIAQWVGIDVSKATTARQLSELISRNADGRKKSPFTRSWKSMW